METAEVSSVSEQVTRLVADQLGVELETVTPASKFIGDLRADSLDVVELVMSLEEEFGVSIPDEDAEKIQTVGDAISYIQNVKH